MKGSEIVDVLNEGVELKEKGSVVGRGYLLSQLENAGIEKGILMRAAKNGLIKKATVTVNSAHRVFFYVPIAVPVVQNESERPRTSAVEASMRNAGTVAGSNPAGAASTSEQTKGRKAKKGKRMHGKNKVIENPTTKETMSNEEAQKLVDSGEATIPPEAIVDPSQVDDGSADRA